MKISRRELFHQYMMSLETLYMTPFYLNWDSSGNIIQMKRKRKIIKFRQKIGKVYKLVDTHIDIDIDPIFPVLTILSTVYDGIIKHAKPDT